MKKRRVKWPLGNPEFVAWEFTCQAGLLVARRNHPAIRYGERRCHGWDLWLDGQFIGAIGSRLVGELISFPRQELLALARSACCGRHREFPFGEPLSRPDRHGGRRPNAGRRPMPLAERRVRLSATIEQGTLVLLDERRGDLSRGQYLDALLRRQR
jgi:hypothetical protein